MFQKMFDLLLFVVCDTDCPLFCFQDNIRDITDSLIDHCEDRKLDENANIQVSDEKIVGIVNDLFGAGELSKNKATVMLSHSISLKKMYICKMF